MTNKKRRSSVLSHASLGTPAPRGSDNGGGHDDTVESQVKPLHISLYKSSSNPGFLLAPAPEKTEENVE